MNSAEGKARFVPLLPVSMALGIRTIPSAFYIYLSGLSDVTKWRTSSSNVDCWFIPLERSVGKPLRSEENDQNPIYVLFRFKGKSCADDYLALEG